MTVLKTFKPTFYDNRLNLRVFAGYLFSSEFGENIIYAKLSTVVFCLFVFLFFFSSYLKQRRDVVDIK